MLFIYIPHLPEEYPTQLQLYIYIYSSSSQRLLEKKNVNNFQTDSLV